MNIQNAGENLYQHVEGLCSRYISLRNVKVADGLLISFCKKFEQLYGVDFVTPNMHLHGHLLDCLFDFGPIYSFWLFSFERENGILGSYPTNRKKVLKSRL